MEIQQLRYVVALAQEKHFRRAAGRVNVTQPTLSQQVKKLETELGRPLFERSSRSVRLTRAGEKFLPYAVSVLEATQKTVSELRDESGVPAGDVRLGVIPTVCPYLMPRVLATLSKAAPRVRVELYEETTSVLLENLRAGRRDLGVLALPVVERGISALSLGREPFFAAVARSHPLASRKSLRRKDLDGERLLILQEGHCFGQQSLDFCKLDRRDPQVSFQGSSLTSVMAMARLGQGLTLVPRMAVEKGTGLEFIPFMAQERPYREIGIVWRLTSPLDRAQKALMAAVEHAMAGHGR